jgi:hypothetical protein
MMPPTSIDGTDITGATIDGTDVQEITVDGQTVFSAQTLPVAYSNLVAWYPFDSATYGGSDADDVTAIIGGSGDDTAYDGTVTGATYQSSGGVTDINAGANSGAFDFDGSNDEIDFGSVSAVEGVSEMTIMCWAEFDDTSTFENIFGVYDSPKNIQLVNQRGTFRGRIQTSSNTLQIDAGSVTTGYQHYAMTFNSGSGTTYIDGSQVGTGSGGPSTTPSGGINFYAGFSEFNNNFWDGRVEDARLYDVALTSTQINQIYQNTEP